MFRALLAVAALITGCNKTPEPVPTIVSLLMVSGSGQSGFVGSVLLDPLVVRAIDQDGVPVSGMEVNWTIVTGGGVATPAEGVSDPDGLVSTTLRLGSTLGTQTVSATLRGGGQPVTFNATATPAPASQVVIVSGDDQTGVVGTRLPADLTVRVTDAFGNPKQGITVFFTVLIGNGSLSSTTAVSDAAGLARVQWTLGPPASTQRVAAQIPGSLPAIFDATGTPGAPALVLVLAGNNQTAQPGSLLPDSLVAQVTDQYENPVRDVSVTWTVASGNGSVSPTGGRTDAVGRISTAWTIGPTGGSKEARAIVSGLPPAIFQAAGTIIFANVMAGGSHTCGLDQAGVAYCWGFNEAGQLGTGAATSGTVPSNLFPNTVVGGRTFQVPAPGGQVPTLNHLASGGGAHTCAIQASTNLAFCWGLNFNGQIGSGSTSPTLLPSPSLVTGTSVYKAVSAG